MQLEFLKWLKLEQKVNENPNPSVMIRENGIGRGMYDINKKLYYNENDIAWKI